MLSSIPDYDYTGKIRLDDLKQPIYLDYSWAANTLITGLMNMTSAEDLIPTLKNMALNKPWINFLI
jgi:hypothetical protein